MNAAGGQYTSLADAVKILQEILNPTRPGSILTPYTVTRWLRAVHEFDEDQWTAIGMMWEAIKHRDTYGRLHKIFWKRELQAYLSTQMVVDQLICSWHLAGISQRCSAAPGLFLRSRCITRWRI